MSKFAIVGTFEIELGQKETVLPLLKAHAERCVKGESGTLQFDLLEPINEDNKIMVYEVYQDEAAFGEHWNGPYVKQIIEETSGMIKNRSGIRCSIID
jgi:quinol monooxygenase YgiN